MPRAALAAMASDSHRARPGSAAERLFVEHALRSEGALDLDALRDAYPEHAAELDALHRRWVEALSGGARVEPVGRLSPGAGARSEGTSATTSAAAGPSGSVLGRLTSHAASGRRYREQGELARGGMGAILEVWDEDLRRTLAMKVALTRAGADAGDSEAAAADARLLERFLEEAQITGQLDHPGIVPVHELGLDSAGRVYFTMRLVKGRDLRAIFELVRKGEEGWTRTRALGVMLKVCEAMAFAHEKGVVHRDLKPANVMVGRFGETYVMDWGLARVSGREDGHDLRLRPGSAALSIVRTDRADVRLPDSPLVTMDGDIVGTPCYMPPEQARGRVEEVGPRSDVYAVGSMLYHLLTGRMPYLDEDERTPPQVVLAALLKGPPEPLAALDPKVPDELIAICEKAMAREPSGRYASMLDMAEDLRAFLEDRVVRAHASGPLAEIRKWVRRNRAAALASAAALLLALAGLVTAVLLQARSNEGLLSAKGEVEAARDAALESERAARAAQREVERANIDLAEAREKAEAQARQARLAEYAANVAAAGASLRLADAADARRRLSLCEESLRGWEWKHLDLASDPSLRDLGPGDVQGAVVAYHPDGTRIAVAAQDGLRLLRVEDGRVERWIEAADLVLGPLAFSPDGKSLAAADQGERVRLWDVESGAQLRSFGAHDGPVIDVAFQPGGALLATASVDKRVRLWDPASGELVRELEGHRGAVTSLAFTPDGARLASGSRDRSVLLWSVADGALVRRLVSSEFPVAFVAADPGGRRLAVGTYSIEGGLGERGESLARGADTVGLWDLESGELLSILAGPGAQLTAGGFSPDGSRLMAASRDSGVWMWDLQAGRDQVLLGHSAGVLDAAFSPDGARLATVAERREIKLWSPEVGLGFPLRGHSGGVERVVFSPDGERLYSASQDTTARAWGTRAGKIEAVSRGHAYAIADLSLSPDGEMLATSSGDQSVRLWEASSGRQVALLGEAPRAEMGLAMQLNAARLDFDPRGAALAVLRPARRLELWDPRTHALLRAIEAGDELASAVRYSPNGELLAVAGGGLQPRRAGLQVLAAGSGEELARRDFDAYVEALAWAPDGSLLAVACGARVLLLDPLDAPELEPRRTLIGHEGSVKGLCFSPDGRRLATGSSDGSVRIWDLASGETLLTLSSPGGGVNDVAFSPDGLRLAAAYDDWSVFLWDTTSPAEREAARAAESAARADVLALLDGLFEAFADPEAVVERLRGDPGLGLARLRTATSMARLVPSDPRAADRESWRSLRVPGQPADEVHLALWSARAADRREPDDERALRLLGAAQVRLGRLEPAIAALERARELRSGRARVEVLAFLAIARHRLGDAAGAREALTELRVQMQVPMNLIRVDNQALSREAEALLEEPPGGG